MNIKLCDNMRNNCIFTSSGKIAKTQVKLFGYCFRYSNRAPGYCNIKDDDRVQSHHTIEQEWARKNIKGYDPLKAPAILLPSSSKSSCYYFSNTASL